MSNYLKMITAGVGVMLLLVLIWPMPLVLRKALLDLIGYGGLRIACIIVGVTAVPSFLCLYKFWGICDRIGRDQSFTVQNAVALKSMSRYMLLETAVYAILLFAFMMIGWQTAPWLLLLIFLIIFAGIALAVVCAALSHLVQKASDMQNEQELTI